MSKEEQASKEKIEPISQIRLLHLILLSIVQRHPNFPSPKIFSYFLTIDTKLQKKFGFSLDKSGYQRLIRSLEHAKLIVVDYVANYYELKITPVGEQFLSSASKLIEIDPALLSSPISATNSNESKSKIPIESGKLGKKSFQKQYTNEQTSILRLAISKTLGEFRMKLTDLGGQDIDDIQTKMTGILLGIVQDWFDNPDAKDL
jgi:hypothetical protein